MLPSLIFMIYVTRSALIEMFKCEVFWIYRVVKNDMASVTDFRICRRYSEWFRVSISDKQKIDFQEELFRRHPILKIFLCPNDTFSVSFIGHSLLCNDNKCGGQ